jgi:hypothetical protein
VDFPKQWWWRDPYADFPKQWVAAARRQTGGKGAARAGALYDAVWHLLWGREEEEKKWIPDNMVSGPPRAGDKHRSCLVYHSLLIFSLNTKSAHRRVSDIFFSH